MINIIRGESESLLTVIHRNEMLQLRDEIQMLKSEIQAMRPFRKEMDFEVKSCSKIAFLSHGDYIVVRPEDIAYCEAQGNYCRIYLTNGKSLFICKTLKQVESILPSKNFTRCHQSYVVNLDQVRQFVVHAPLCLTIETGQKIPVSRRKKSKILRYYKSM